MEHHFTRQELYDRVWSRPMSHLIAELGTTAAILGTLLRRADIPTPSSGHWMRKEFGKPVEQPSLPPTPSGCVEPLVLDTEEQGVRRKPKHVVLFAEVLGEKVEFQLREKQKQERRPLTDDEKRWRSPGDSGWKKELVPTGWLVFEIKTSQWPDGLPRQWLESEKQPMEGMLPDILATFVTAGPLLVQQRKDREAAERERQLAEQRRYEEQRRRKREANRWRRFQELAQDWHKLAAVHDFLTELRSMCQTPLNRDPSFSSKRDPFPDAHFLPLLA